MHSQPLPANSPGGQEAHAIAKTNAPALLSVVSTKIYSSARQAHYPAAPSTAFMVAEEQGKHLFASWFGASPAGQAVQASSPVKVRAAFTYPTLQVQARPVASGTWFFGHSRQAKAAVSNHLSDPQRSSFGSMDAALLTPMLEVRLRRKQSAQSKLAAWPDVGRLT